VENGAPHGKRRFEEQGQKHKSGQKKQEHGPRCDEFLAQESADSSDPM
jgi:hypothetical protein